MRIVLALLLCASCASGQKLTPIDIGAIVVGAAALGGGIALVTTGESTQAWDCAKQAISPALTAKVATEFAQADGAVDLTSDANMEVLIAAAGKVVECVALDLWMDHEAKKAQAAVAATSAPPLPHPELVAKHAKQWCLARGLSPQDAG